MVLHGVRWKRLRSLDEALGFGASSDKRGHFSRHEHGFFPREGVGYCPWVVALSRVSRSVLNLWLVASCCGARVALWTYTKRKSASKTTTTIIQSGEAPFSQARSLHPTLGS